MRNLLAGAVVALSLAGCAVQAQHPTSLSDEEFADYASAMQDMAWYGHGGGARPHVEPTVVALDEVENARAACMAANELSDDACAVSFISDSEDIGYLSSSELNYVYDYYASELVPCLATQGLDVGHAPTRAEFTAAGWMSWDPYTALGAELPPSRSDTIYAACPPYPPMPFLEIYG